MHMFGHFNLQRPRVGLTVLGPAAALIVGSLQGCGTDSKHPASMVGTWECRAGAATYKERFASNGEIPPDGEYTWEMEQDVLVRTSNSGHQERFVVRHFGSSRMLTFLIFPSTGRTLENPADARADDPDGCARVSDDPRAGL